MTNKIGTQQAFNLAYNGTVSVSNLYKRGFIEPHQVAEVLQKLKETGEYSEGFLAQMQKDAFK